MVIAALSYAQKTTTASASKNVITKIVPRSLDIEDKVIVSNKTSYNIERIVVALVASGGRHQSLWASNNIDAGDDVEIASYRDDGLKRYRGKKLAIKIKGQNAKTKKVTYNFNVRFYESRHDLYIEITPKYTKSRKSVMDF